MECATFICQYFTNSYICLFYQGAWVYADSMTGVVPMIEDKSKGKKVLIVEDNDLNMKLFDDLLSIHGYETIRVRDGMMALPLAREHLPDLILMDIQLPDISGLDVTKWIKEDEGLKHIPVIAVTAFAMKGDEEKILGGGCEDYIAKPISVTQLIETVQRYLH